MISEPGSPIPPVQPSSEAPATTTIMNTLVSLLKGTLVSLLKGQNRTAVFLILLIVLLMVGYRSGISESNTMIFFYVAVGVYTLMHLVDLFVGSGRTGAAARRGKA